MLFTLNTANTFFHTAMPLLYEKSSSQESERPFYWFAHHNHGRRGIQTRNLERQKRSLYPAIHPKLGCKKTSPTTHIWCLVLCILGNSPLQGQGDRKLHWGFQHKRNKVWACPCGVGGVDRASSSDARGLGFQPRSLWKYHFFTPEPSRHTAGSLNWVKEAG